jgi:hypothetical protein
MDPQHSSMLFCKRHLHLMSVAGRIEMHTHRPCDREPPEYWTGVGPF